jgi:hypothetical protein
VRIQKRERYRKGGSYGNGRGTEDRRMRKGKVYGIGKDTGEGERDRRGKKATDRRD